MPKFQISQLPERYRKQAESQLASQIHSLAHAGIHVVPVEPNPPLVITLKDKESDLHEKIIEFCKRRQWLCFHGAMHKRAWRNLGEPDFQIYADGGKCFLVEAKTAKGKLTPEQIGVAMLAEKLGHKVHCVRSFEDFIAAINETQQPKTSHE